VSYILDALKKAADQRDVHAPAMQRLLGPAPEVVDASRWRMAITGGAAALGGAAVVGALWLMWPSAPVMVTETLDLPPATARALPQESPPVVQPPPPPAPPIVRTTPAPAAPAKATATPATTTAEKQPPATTSRPVEARQPPATKSRTAETRRPPVDDDDPPAVTPPVVSVVRPPPAVTAPAPPPTPAAAAPRSERGGPAMKLEVIVYSEERARRLAFINGRKYVEGDTLLDGSKVQEIQANAVVLVENGRRVLLRP
jgi:hypothetical protein